MATKRETGGGVLARINPILWRIDEARAGDDDEIVVTHNPGELTAAEFALFAGRTEHVLRHNHLGEIEIDEDVPLVVKAK